MKIGQILKAVNVEGTPFKVNKFYEITDGDCIGSLEVGGLKDLELTMKDVSFHFKCINTREDIDELGIKANRIKEKFLEIKNNCGDASTFVFTDESIFEEAIASLSEEFDELELRFIYNNMDVLAFEQCSCCGEIILAVDELNYDSSNDSAPLCGNCSEFNDVTKMYERFVHKEVIEKITGYKFSTQIGDIDNIIKDFNIWLKRYKPFFTFNSQKNKEVFAEYVHGNTDWNICEHCGEIDKSHNVIWTKGGDFEVAELKTAIFATETLGLDMVCEACFDKIHNRTKLTLNEVVSRIRKNKMVFREGDFVALKNVDSSSLKICKVLSIDETCKTYQIEGYAERKFYEEDFFDVANEAYTEEYIKFVKKENSDIEEDIQEWSYSSEYINPKINEIIDEFGYRKEFIRHLIDGDIPFGRVMTPKFKIGDSFSVHFNYYEKDELTKHIISRIDTSFEESDEIVYWDDQFVYIVESELIKQKNSSSENELTMIIKNDIVKNMFIEDLNSNIVVPTYLELSNAKRLSVKWELTNEYNHYSLGTIIHIVDGLAETFFGTFDALEKYKKEELKKKKYHVRVEVEFGVSEEIISELQILNGIYESNDSCSLPLLTMQDSREEEDFLSIEVVLGCDINYEGLMAHLKTNTDADYHEEIISLIETIKEAKSDGYHTLHLFDN